MNREWKIIHYLNWNEWRVKTYSLFKGIHTLFPRGGNGREAPLNAFVFVRERNSSQASKLEKDSRRKSFIYLSNLEN